VILSGCGAPQEPLVAKAPIAFGPVVGTFTEVASPAYPGAGQPHVAVAGDRFLVSWTEPAGEAHTLKLAHFDAAGFEEPHTVATRDDFFVNWADFPSVTASGGVIYAHWLQRSAPGTYNYDVMVAISQDGGASWSEPFVVHDDGVAAEHGFVSMLPLPDSRVGITWLDGREMGEGHGEGHGDMSLRYAEIAPDGTISGEVVLDERTCECCTTTITATPAGPLVAWRDRSAEEVRDISLSRRLSGGWTEPATLHEDGWQIEGCPVNGPQADAIEGHVAVAWYTAAEGSGSVKIAFSEDGGATFGAPYVLGAGVQSVGYVDVLLLAKDRALVVWMEEREDRLELVGREVSLQGDLANSVVIAATTRGRTGFPRMAKSGDEILLAWNEKGESPGIHVARATISN